MNFVKETDLEAITLKAITEILGNENRSIFLKKLYCTDEITFLSKNVMWVIMMVFKIKIGMSSFKIKRE